MGSLQDHIEQKYLAENRIYAAIIELTERCPADCVHCYLVKNPADEMTLDEVCDYLGQLRREGAFNLSLSGGDPLVRRDIAEILAEARRHRFFTSVLTSGLPVTDSQAAMLATSGVGMVEMSILGGDAETHDAMTRVPGAFRRLEQATRRLVERGVHVTLKATMLKPNRNQLSAMDEISRSWGAAFNASVSLAPRTDGDLQPLDLSLAPEDVARLEPRLVAAGLIPGEDFGEGALLTCRAGRTIVAINAVGDVYPCVMFPAKVGSLRDKTLQQIWHDEPDPFLVELRALRDADVTDCVNCEMRRHCRRCPGAAWLETGELGKAAPSDCDVARGLGEGIARIQEGRD